MITIVYLIDNPPRTPYLRATRSHGVAGVNKAAGWMQTSVRLPDRALRAVNRRK
jgi:hypothetical protein